MVLSLPITIRVDRIGVADTSLQKHFQISRDTHCAQATGRTHGERKGHDYLFRDRYIDQTDIWYILADIGGRI